ncbi:ribulose-5-phosphate 4-epimerase/fuculose-1-phosphate aldolase [Sphingobium jiangsuense]|uniref:Ribulose-5-phosphate 4-epimerase/fuculose-1-phosphate aldolase n=1 Tax=Sphingobium jiangsuense TaxID=870476 RepID=A0A7W6FRQ5_9SPHN|nr:class II aldolase/adducin family protein [Sphingobium jiangsuense]MBB3928406.1 ribulose-5-phosphate 4-epimerase/fuculose-1-phosphate aldolase [Sphingobium jiangsuense]
MDEMTVRTRRELAACYRLVHHFRMSDLIASHISSRIPGKEGRLLINPFGSLFNEVTASNLVEISCEGQVHEPAGAIINPAGLLIHSAVHAARPEIACVIHVHSAAGVAVSAQEEGLLPISQQALVVMDRLAYHDYEGVALLEGEKARLQADLGDARAMILRNHGLLAVGESIGEAFYWLYMLQKACEIQLLAQSGGAALRMAPTAIRQLVTEQTCQFAGATMGSREWVALMREVERIAPDYAD